MAHLNSSIFLDEGAFVIWSDHVYVFQGPFETVQPVNQQMADLGTQLFFDSQQSFWKASVQAQLNREEFYALLGDYSSGPITWNWLDPSLEDYEKTFQEHYAAIKSGVLRKAVPFVFAKNFQFQASEHLVSFIRRITQYSAPLIPFGFWRRGGGVLGLTPEYLFHQIGDQVTSMALAGTERKGTQPSKMLKDLKLQKEHQIVVEELARKWQHFGKVLLGTQELMELPTLYHLHTPLTIKPEVPWNPLQVIQFLHPSSAVGVDPASQWRSLEDLSGQKQRDYYGAPLFFRLSPKESLAIVALRQVQWDNIGIRLAAGGGIVLESSLELEWDEVLAKIESVKKLFGVE